VILSAIIGTRINLMQRRANTPYLSASSSLAHTQQAFIVAVVQTLHAIRVGSKLGRLFTQHVTKERTQLWSEAIGVISSLGSNSSSLSQWCSLLCGRLPYTDDAPASLWHYSLPCP
jgi:hypothetical protein